jgi:hypothetical protein
MQEGGQHMQDRDSTCRTGTAHAEGYSTCKMGSANAAGGQHMQEGVSTEYAQLWGPMLTVCDASEPIAP